jgi:hypothetical protein
MVEDLTGGGVDHQIGGALGADDKKAPGVGHRAIVLPWGIGSRSRRLLVAGPFAECPL